MEILDWDGALQEDCPHCNVWSIHLHDGLASWVRLNQYRSRGEASLELGEGPSLLRGSMRMESTERWAQWEAITSDERTIKVGKAHELLKLFYCCGFGPLCHCLDLFLTCPHLPTLSNVHQETYAMNIELGFFWPSWTVHFPGASGVPFEHEGCVLPDIHSHKNLLNRCQRFKVSSEQ